MSKGRQTTATEVDAAVSAYMNTTIMWRSKKNPTRAIEAYLDDETHGMHHRQVEGGLVLVVVRPLDRAGWCVGSRRAASHHHKIYGKRRRRSPPS